MYFVYCANSFEAGVFYAYSTNRNKYIYLSMDGYFKLPWVILVVNWLA